MQNKTEAFGKAVVSAGCPFQAQMMTLDKDAYPMSDKARLEVDKYG